MAKEIERKFLVDLSLWPTEGRKIEMQQAYLVIESQKVIRVRIADQKGFITIKANRVGISRDEFEYEIPLEDAKAMMGLSIGAIIDKSRYLYEYCGKTWEIDVFKGENEGLVVAEIELNHEDEAFEKPEWIREEVSNDIRYYNFQLSQNPFASWQ